NLIVSSAGAITQSGVLTVTGTSSFTTTANNTSITLNNAANALTGPITFAPNGSGNVSLTNSVGTQIAASTIGRNLSVTEAGTGGAETQTGILSVTGTTTINAGGNGITLATAGDSFTGLVSLTTTGANDASLVNVTATQFAASNIGRNLTVS